MAALVMTGSRGAFSGDSHRSRHAGKSFAARPPDAVVVYGDSATAVPIITSYALAHRSSRWLKRLYGHRVELLRTIREACFKAKRKNH